MASEVLRTQVGMSLGMEEGKVLVGMGIQV